MEMFKDQPVLELGSVSEWREWLMENHDIVPAVWIKLAKKGSGANSPTYEEARDAAIAHGWIDGIINRWDENFYITRFTPRKKKSNWSKINCAIAEALIEAGTMHPAGVAHVEEAKRDGRWERAYDSSSTITVPDDLQLALNENPAAAGFFAGINAANRYAFLYRVQTASSAAKREKAILKTIKMLSEGELYHP